MILYSKRIATTEITKMFETLIQRRYNHSEVINHGYSQIHSL